MHWIDIDLAEPERRQAAAPLLSQAAARAASLPSLQATEGADSRAVVRLMAETGQSLWRAVLATDPLAFSPTHDHAGGMDPRVGVAEADHVHGYHLIVQAQDLTLPWTWLHNGLGFLMVRYPVAAGPAGTWSALTDPRRPWMDRHRDALLAELAVGTMPPARTAERARRHAARILFLAGHCEADVRPLLYREAEAIDGALAAAAPAPPLAALCLPEGALAPGTLARVGGGWQAFHFAGPTARPPTVAAEEPWTALAEGGWLNGSTAAGAEAALALEEVGELELVGVDPITALLDQLAVRAEQHARAGDDGRASPPPAASAVAVAPPWLLEDGPIRPEDLGRAGGAPPLVFSNSYLSLPALGPRFLAAGASTFVGPVAAVLSGPAREFAARFYGCLGDGWATAAALRGAALACRERFGEEHPVWLSYGVIGHGSLALQYL